MSLHTDLVAAGLDVQTITGWGTRGGSWTAGQPVGLMEHHTAPPVPYPVTGLYGTLLKANINVKPDGTVWLIAARACNYSSGSGSSRVLAEVRAGTPPTANARERGLTDDTNGNPWFFNFEVDHPGDGSPIPPVQLDAVVTATGVVLDFYGLSPGNVLSHAEWTYRKRDPYWNGSLRAIDEIRSLLEETNMAFSKGLSEAQWRNLYQLGIAKGASEQAVVDYWTSPSRTDEQHEKASAEMFETLAERPTSSGLKRGDSVKLV